MRYGHHRVGLVSVMLPLQPSLLATKVSLTSSNDTEQRDVSTPAPLGVP